MFEGGGGEYVHHAVCNAQGALCRAALLLQHIHPTSVQLGCGEVSHALQQLQRASAKFVVNRLAGEVCSQVRVLKGMLLVLSAM